MKSIVLARAVGIVAFLTVLSKILGLAREASLAAVFGATGASDAYLVAQTIPFLFFSVVSVAINTTFIPVYSHIREEEGGKAALEFARLVLWSLVLIGIFLVGTGEILADILVRLVAPGYSGDQSNLTVYLSRIMFPMMIFQLVSGVTGSVLQAHERFAIATTAGVVQNLAIIVSTVLFAPRYGITAVAIGTTAGAGLSTLIKVPVLRCLGFRWGIRLGWSDRRLRRMVMLMPPAMVGAGAGQINTLVDRILASGLAEGSIAALNFATRIAELAPGIVGTSIITVVYPTLSRVAARGDIRRFGKAVTDSLGLLFLALGPVAVGVFVLREPLVRVAFERGAFDPVATRQTAWGLMFLSGTIAVSSMRKLVSRAFYSLEDTRTPMALGLATMGSN